MSKQFDYLAALHEAEKRIERQETYLKTLNLIGEVLLSAKYETFNEALTKVSEIIGQIFYASQVAIFKLSTARERFDCESLCSWQQKSDNQSQYCTYMPESWMARLIEGDLIFKTLTDASDMDREFLHSNNLNSAMIIPIIKETEVWGCISLLYKTPYQTFNAEDKTAVLSIAKLLSSAIMQNDYAGLLTNSFNTNRDILDSNPFISIMFDENSGIDGCNLSARSFFGLEDLKDAKEIFTSKLNAIVPEYQPNGRRSVPFIERLKTAFSVGYCEFETRFFIQGDSVYYNIIMKRILYKNRPAVVTYMFDLTPQKEVQFELEYHGELLEAIGSVANSLLMMDAKDLDSTIYDTMSIIGRAVSVDRVYVWKNHTGDDGRLYTSRLFEWSPDVEQLSDEHAINISYDDTIPSWEKNLKQGVCLNSRVKDTTPEEQAQFIPQGIKSILIVPIFMQDKFWGFAGFDDCKRERVFSVVEENILRICGFMSMVISDTIQNEMSTHLLAEREAALISAQIKTNFLANMSHEIRTPMNAIMGMAELIMHENATNTVLTYAVDIRNACRGLLAIINDILDISKIESGKLEIVPVRYHISSLLMDVISIIKTRSDKKSIAFIVNIDTNIPSELFGDELRIKQILINLLNNAVSFTEEGYIKLSVSSEIADGLCQLTFSVSDTGIGIKQEDKEKIFFLFQQVDTKKNRNINGTGLGLPISKQLAEMMGGSLEIESEHGVGSTFTVLIKQNITNNLPVTALKHPERNTVLIYENRSAYLDSVTYALDSLGCNYKICANRMEILENLDNFKCDYIFVSSLYVNKIQTIAARKQPNAVIVILNGDGNPYYKGSIISVSMPIHCLKLANILNDEYDSYDSRIHDSYTTNIIAPEAVVLVVDDNAVNLKVAVGLLNIYKIQADTASNGMEALKMVSEKDYDLIFMDHMMPEMDGIDTTVAIRNLGEKYVHLPIVALTANAIGGVKEMFKAEGLNDFIAKPVEMSKLNEILKKWLPDNIQIMAAETINTEMADFSISGLDTRRGLINSGGILEKYNDILSIYVADSENKLEELMKNHKAGDLSALIDGVHAVKGSSANVGAEDISIMASELEMAGKTGDINYIDANLRVFSDSLSLLIANIRSYLSNLRKEDIVCSKAADLGFLKAALVKIEMYMNDLDIDSMESLADELCTYKWDDDIFEFVTKIKACLDIFDYDGIETAVNGLKVLCND